jgi:hypothetical protein
MLYWECKRRLANLRQFRLLAVDYFRNVRYVSRQNALRGQALLNDTAENARHKMNQLVPDIVESLDLLEVARIVTWTPPPMIGGYIQNVDLIGNVFGLTAFDIPSQSVFDCLDRGIGAYERERRTLLLKSFNPLYWLGLATTWLLSLPFKLLGAAGFDANKAENSFIGRSLKLAWGAVLGFGTLIPALDIIAHSWLRRVFHISQ